jgi:two-component system, response regulator YesN
MNRKKGVVKMLKVLIVDDEPGVRKRLRNVIKWEDYGFTIVGEGCDGEEGLSMALLHKPDLLITDIRMPVFSGLELTKKVKAVINEIYIVVLSGFSDFEYAHEAIKYGVKDYLLKPIDEDELIKLLYIIKQEIEVKAEAHRKLNNAKKILKQKLVRDMINNRNKLNSSEISKELELEFNNRCFTVFTIEIDDFENFILEKGEEDAFALRERVLSIIEDNLNLNKNGILLEDNLQRFIVFRVLERKNESINFLKATAQNIKTVIEGCIYKTITVGIGKPINDLSKIQNCFKQAKDCIESKFVLGKNRVITFEDINQTSVRTEWNIILEWDKQKLYEAIENKRTEDVISVVSQLFSILRAKKSNTDFISSIIIENFIGIVRIITEKKGDVFKIVDENFIIEKHIRNQQTLDELEVWFKSTCLKAAEYIFLLRNNRPRKVSDRVVEIIKNNYFEDITLKSIAGIIYMSPVYLGHLFKNDIGKSFNDYLTEVRIQKATKLLLDTDLPIYEIAEKVGYNAAGNFYAAFKKLERCNPMDYREGKVVG